MQALEVIELLAGYDAQGQPVLERIPVRTLEDDSCQLVKSPAFIKGIASGDVIKVDAPNNAFELVERSGNLCIRIYSRSGTEALAENLVPELEKLGAELDTENPRMLVLSIHVSCGFSAIEALLKQHVQGPDAMWLYGNVYDPADGQTPLNWWQKIIDEN
ncbi:MAG: DUF4265 domain-containing protein [Cellvibrionaceae bacterium]|nr:DUF4265 domain-containing protein [Cellvibrionaceae bacterium]MCV6624951.1 DUF4265 domain-containing protein [Cellvibrionaceae bacterium]